MGIHLLAWTAWIGRTAEREFSVIVGEDSNFMSGM
jgi:hypothetical protein